MRPGPDGSGRIFRGACRRNRDADQQRVRSNGKTIIEVAICIPARNEAAELPTLFEAIERLEWDGARLLNVCLLLDGCIDDSARLVSAYRLRSRHRVWLTEIERPSANVGVARHRAMMMGRNAVGSDDAMLLSTDADSMPRANWLTAMLHALRQAELVAGKIIRVGGGLNPLQDRIESYYDRLATLRRRLDPVSWEAPIVHHHVGGANIGVRADAYRALGGFVPVAFGEDARLIDDASRAGLRVRRDAACVVDTSARHAGRVIEGLASSLRSLAGADAGSVTVAHPADATWQYRRQAQARAAHAQDRLDLVAAAVGLTQDHVRGVARDCPNAEAFAMRVVPEPPGGMRLIALQSAERELDLLDACERAA